MMTLSKKIDAGEATPDDYDRLVALLQVDKVNDIARALRAIDCSLTDPRLAVDWETVFAAENVEFDIEGLEEVMTRVRRLLVQLGQLVTVTRHHNPNCPRCGNPMTEWQNKRTGVCGFKCTRSCRQRAYEARKAGSGT
jgi:siroheme synthase